MNIRYGIILLFSTFCFLRCGHLKPKPSLSGDIAVDLKTLLQEGKTEVQIMDSVVRTPREMELTFRMQEASEKNQAWYNEYLNQYKQMRVPPYHINFGLTEKEYDELVQMKLNMVLVPSATHTIYITSTNNILGFNTQGRIPYLEEVKIDTKTNTISLANGTLHFSDTVFVANENHALKSMWKGYTWRFDEPAEDDTISELLITKHYSISIGVLYKTGQTLINIREYENNDGENSLKIEKPLVLRKI